MLTLGWSSAGMKFPVQDVEGRHRYQPIKKCVADFEKS